MKKIVALLLTCYLLLIATSFFASAEQLSGDVFNGTPEIDGILDEIYLKSAAYALDFFGMYNWGEGTYTTDTTATAYFLWDSDYLYVAVEVHDSTPLSQDGTNDAWKNDSAENWFIEDGYFYKIAACADGGFRLDSDGDGYCEWTFEDAKHAARWTDFGYVVEMALPMNEMAAGKEFAYSLQVNDIIKSDGSVGSAHGGKSCDGDFVCVADKAAPETTEHITEPVPEDNPPTSDFALAAGAAFVISAAAAVFVKKKNKI